METPNPTRSAPGRNSENLTESVRELNLAYGAHVAAREALRRCARNRRRDHDDDQDADEALG